MPHFTVPNDIVENLVAIFRGAVPPDLASMDRTDNSDDVYAACEALALAEGVSANLQRMAHVSFADALYLELHARQVGLFKQAGETDPQLRARIQTPPLAVTPDLILQAMQGIVDANGGGTVYLLELPRDGFRYGRKQCYGRGWRWASSLHGVVVVLIPASLPQTVVDQCTDALRAKVLAAKSYLVQQYT